MTPRSATSYHNDSDVVTVQKSKYVRRARLKVKECIFAFQSIQSMTIFVIYCRVYSQLNVKSLLVNCWLVRGSLFIELGCRGDLGKGWRGDLGTFMISRPI